MALGRGSGRRSWEEEQDTTWQIRNPTMELSRGRVRKACTARNLLFQLAPGKGGRTLRTQRRGGSGLKLVGKPSPPPVPKAEAAWLSGSPEEGDGRLGRKSSWPRQCMHIPGCSERPLGKERVPAFESTNVTSHKRQHWADFCYL